MDTTVDAVHDADSSVHPDGKLLDSPGGSLNSTEPSASAHVFRRAYKACDSCRQRKVRCDLGSVENPVEPPCRRCRRERRECTFVHGLRGRTRAGPGGGARHSLPDGGPINAYPSSERFTLVARSLAQPYAEHQGGAPTLPPLSSIAPQYATPGAPAHPPMRPLPSGTSPRGQTEHDTHRPSQSGSTGLRSSASPTARASLALVSLSSSTEAIRVLAEQGTASPAPSSNNDPPHRSDEDWPDTAERERSRSRQGEKPPVDAASGPRKRPHEAVSEPSASRDHGPSAPQEQARPSHLLRPDATAVPVVTPPRPSPEMLEIWSRSGPVRRGMVTAEQAHYLVGYYFSQLHGFSPLCSERFIRFHSDVEVCAELALEENLLLAAILAISSRYAHFTAEESTKGSDDSAPETGGEAQGTQAGGEARGTQAGGEARGTEASCDARSDPVNSGAGREGPSSSEPGHAPEPGPRPWAGGIPITLQQHIDLSRWAYERSGHVLTNPSMHTIGTIEGLLILSEWGTWQMHDDSTGGGGEGPRENETPNGHGQKQYSQEKDVLRRASGRYDSMVWLLVGCAVRLAEQLDLPKVEHVKCILDAGTEGPRRSSRPPPSPEELERAERRVQVWMSCVQIEASVSVRLGRRFTSAGLSPEWMELIRARTHQLPEVPPLRSPPPAPPANPEEKAAREEQERMEQVRRELVQANINLAFPDDLVGSAAARDPELNEYRKWVAWRGHAELAAKMRRTYELLYESESRSHNMIENDSFEGFLRPLRADLDHWVQWLEPKIGYPGGGMRAYNIRIHYHFTRLVLFRIGLDALVQRASKGTLDLRDGTGITDRAAFPMAKEAVDAARTLAIIISVDLASLRCAPPRIFLYLVLSVLLCMQAAELSDALMQPLQCASILRHAITALMNVSLDSRHLSRVYAILLRKVGATVLKHEERLGQHHTLPPFSDPALVEKLNEARSRHQHSRAAARANSTVLRPRGQLHPVPRPPKRRRPEQDSSASAHTGLQPPALPHSRSDSILPGPSLSFDSAHVFPVANTHANANGSAGASSSANANADAGAGARTGPIPRQHVPAQAFWSAQAQAQSAPSSRSNSALPFFTQPPSELPYQMTPSVPHLSPVQQTASVSGASPASNGDPSPSGAGAPSELNPLFYSGFMNPPPSFAGDIVPSVQRVEDILSFFGSVDETFNLLPERTPGSDSAAVAQAADAGALLGLSDADAARLAMVGGDPALNSWPLLLNLNPALHN